MKAYFAILGSFSLALTVAKADIGIYINSGYFYDDAGGLFPNDGLLQLVNLGEDGISNPIVEGSWVGGDDMLIDLSYTHIDGSAGDFASSGGFDLWAHSGGPGYEGILDRFFNFSSAPGILDEGDKVEIRWWADYTASDFHNGATPQAGQSYGTGRLDEAVIDPHNNSAWIIPNESEPITILDPLLSPDLAALYALPPSPDFTGEPDKQVIPEPATASFLFGLAAVGFVLKQRRKSTHKLP